MLQEEMFWKQKSTDKWISLGDNKTSYFHRSVVSHHTRNKILALKAEDNTWVTNQEMLKGMAINFFKTLYTDDSSLCRLETNIVFPNIGNDNS